MKSYIEIQVPSLSLSASRGALPGPAGTNPSKPTSIRLPGPVGAEIGTLTESRFLEEMIHGGIIRLELDNNDNAWRIQPPAFAQWRYYLPATHGTWARSGNEITVCDEINKRIYFSLRQTNKLSGRAYYALSPASHFELQAEWKRVPKPLPESRQPHIWYGLAIGENGGLMTGMRGAAAVVVSANKWFTFFMPATAAGASKGYSWSTAFVLLTGYVDQGDLIAHKGSAVDYELSVGRAWSERAAPLAQVATSKFEDLIQFALRNSEMLRGLAMAAVEGTCVDYDEKQVILCDLLGASIGAGVYSYTGECVPQRVNQNQ